MQQHLKQTFGVNSHIWKWLFLKYLFLTMVSWLHFGFFRTSSFRAFVQGLIYQIWSKIDVTVPETLIFGNRKKRWKKIQRLKRWIFNTAHRGAKHVKNSPPGDRWITVTTVAVYFRYCWPPARQKRSITFCRTVFELPPILFAVFPRYHLYFLLCFRVTPILFAVRPLLFAMRPILFATYPGYHLYFFQRHLYFLQWHHYILPSKPLLFTVIVAVNDGEEG